MENIEVVKAKLIAYKKDYYSTLVFENLNKEDEYVMCIVPPNWKEPIPEPNEIGFLSYEKTVAGKTKYFNKSTQTQRFNLYTNNYFNRFVALNNDNQNNLTVNIT